MKKKIISVSLALILAISIFPVAAASASMSNFAKARDYRSGQFNDVNESAWYGASQQRVIATAFEYGLMSGNSSVTFNPTGNISVAEALAVAVRVYSIFNGGAGEFSQGSPWYQIYVDYAQASGIINAGDFTDYTRYATRAEMAYIFSSSIPAAQFTSQNIVNFLPDVNSGTPHSESILTLYRAGVLTGGDADGTFYPGNNISRAEAAAIISRVILPDTRTSGRIYGGGGDAGRGPDQQQPSDGGQPGGSTGAVVSVYGEMEFSFTPASSGWWKIYTSDCEGDPILTLLDERGNIIAWNDDYFDGLNAHITAQLVMGISYTIIVEFYDGESSCLLTIAPSAPPLSIPAGGGEVYVSEPTEFQFIPDQSGVWEFVTSDNGGSDPVLIFYNSSGNRIGYSDDDGDELNALLYVYFDAGETYYILADFYTSGSYYLNITYVIGPSDTGGDLTTITLPSYGGDIYVDGETLFEFTPDFTSVWIAETYGNGYSDPVLTIYDAYGDIIASDDDSGGSYNAIIAMFLEEGETYYIHVEFWSGDMTCRLSVSLPGWLSDYGGDIAVFGPTVFYFSPYASDIWEFRTFNSYGTDPYIGILRFDGEYVEFDDDSGGNLEAYMSVYLERGVTYLIVIGFYDGYGECVLSIS